MEAEKTLSEKESLDLIAMMINRAKDSNHDTGVSAIMWGIIIAVCALEKFAEKVFSFRLPFDIYLITILAVIPQVIINIRESRQKKVRTYEDAFMDFLWMGFGISIFLLIFITNTMFQSTALTPQFSEFIASLFLMLYGMPTFVTGAACKFKPMLIGGIFTWTCCLVSLFTPILVDHLLVAVSAIIAWLVPGIILERDYRQAKKELAKAHV